MKKASLLYKRNQTNANTEKHKKAQKELAIQKQLEWI